MGQWVWLLIVYRQYLIGFVLAKDPLNIFIIAFLLQK